MQVLGERKKEPSLPQPVEEAGPCDWSSMYTRSPHGKSTLFDLEAMVAKRMELLAWIDQTVNKGDKSASSDSIYDQIAKRLPAEQRGRPTRQSTGTTLGVEEESLPKRSASREATQHGAGNHGIVFEQDEDLLSHLLCRYAFCMSERWRKWFVSAEEALLRARLKVRMAREPANCLTDLMTQNGLPCTTLSEKELANTRVQEYMAYRKTKEADVTPESFLSVPMALATRLIKKRDVLCSRGRVIMQRKQVLEVFFVVFRSHLNKGLHEAYLARIKQQNLEEEGARNTVINMLDTFLEQFIADPSDNLKEGVAGSVGAGDIQGLAQVHFPLCMRMIDSHLRREGHLKHHGRFTYGLFLKAIGLSMDDAMALFSSLMTQKGGGSVEAFRKTAYGYNVRHNYGMEGKKTSYSSASCGTLLALPPMVDKSDCHGCPFRFRDEGAFRAMLQKEQKNPLGKEFPDIRPMQSDIEDIIQDCKGQHYTRACYKYFMATHPTAKRDSLFRSPYEYYCCSKEVENVPEESNSPGEKRPSQAMAPTLNEDNVRLRTAEK